MSKFSFSNAPRLQLLSRDQIESIHLASMKLLEEVGVKVYNDTALKLLGDAGVEVDFDNKLACIPQHARARIMSAIFSRHAPKFY